MEMHEGVIELAARIVQIAAKPDECSRGAHGD